jgi:hypothetical protein
MSIVLGSQALETAIGLALLFFVAATAASTVVEVIARLLGKRSQNLEAGIAAMLGDDADGPNAVSDALGVFKGTSVYTAACAAAGKSFLARNAKNPSYLSAKAFADGICEMLVDGGGLRPLDSLPINLQRRLRPLALEAGGDLIAVKSGLERWFDETMQRAAGAYKRWATSVLFAVGLFFAVSANISTVHVADQLWQSPVTRQAVVDAAGKVVAPGASPTQLDSVASTTSRLQELSLPIGWDQAARSSWHSVWWQPWHWGLSRTATFMGWLVTALLVMLGGPFWFDLLTRLVSLRSSGIRPPPAADDPASATRAGLASASAGPGDGQDGTYPALPAKPRKLWQRATAPATAGGPAARAATSTADPAEASLAAALGVAPA